MCPGTYNEAVDIGKTLTLLGAQAGVDARTARGPESVWTNACGPVRIGADNVVIDGFTVEGSTDSDPCTIAGIWMNPGALGFDGGAKIYNNIIQNNISGLELDNTGALPAEVKFNLFRNNNNPGPGSGNAIQTNFGLSKALIDSNRFSGHTSSSFLVVATSDTITFSNNELVGGASEGVLWGVVSDSSISGNTSIGSATSAAIWLFGGNSSISITGNTLANGMLGILVNDAFAVGINDGVTAGSNCIQGNSTAGLEVDADGHSGTLNAENNWWGSATGPTHPTNPGGTGDLIVDPDGNVDFVPFLTTSPGGTCPPLPPPPPHDAKLLKLASGGKDIHLKTAGTATRKVELRTKNESKHTDLIRTVLEIAGLPAGCTAENLSTSVVVASPGGLLLDDTSSYTSKQQKNFDFDMRITCSPVPTNAPITLTGKVDHNADDYPAADDDDTKPSNNVKTNSHVLKK